MKKLYKIIIGIAIVLMALGIAILHYLYARQYNQAALEIPAAPPTQVITYAALLPAGAVATQSGYCFTNSVAAPYRQDAWRCMINNEIFDPCFQIPGNDNLLCNPETSSEFLLSLDKDLPASQVPAAAPTNWAWRVELADGTMCTPFTGTRPFSADGQVAIYSCNGGAGEQMVFGDLNNSKFVWTADVGELSDPAKKFPPDVIDAKIVAVAKVWQ